MKQFKIVIDTKGSDNGAEMMIRGADLALKKYPELSVLLVGDTDVMKRECERLSMPMDRVELLEAPETITNYGCARINKAGKAPVFGRKHRC